MEQSQYDIKDVALYLRKSRGETDQDLAKHKMALTEIAESAGWRYVIYEEIGNSESIKWRPKMQQLLRDVEQGLYDAVAAVDIDRLGRGDLADQARWRGVFSKAEVIIITPTGWFNPANEEEELNLDIRTLFARQEYRMIVRRLQRGKKLGAKKGEWTNGPPPFPYVYDREKKTIFIDYDDPKRPTDLAVYNMMKDMALSGVPLYKIATTLNNIGIKTRRGKWWDEMVIHRILTSQVHLGMVVSGKTKGSKHRKKATKPYEKLPPDQWIVTPGKHKGIKTQEEHARLIATLYQHQIVPKAARKGAFVLSGIVRCGLCGSMMAGQRKKQGYEMLKKCQNRDPFGNCCTNRGVAANIFFTIFFHRFAQHEQDLLSGRRELVTIPAETMLESKLAELTDQEQARNRAEEQYIITGKLTKERFEQLTTVIDQKVQTLRAEIAELRQALAKAELTPEERLDRIQAFKSGWTADGVTDEERNRLLKTLVERITYTRRDDEVDLDIRWK